MTPEPPERRTGPGRRGEPTSPRGGYGEGRDDWDPRRSWHEHDGRGPHDDARPNDTMAAFGRGMRGAANATGRFGRFAARTARRAADAQGAAESGLNRLIYLQAANSAGDAAFTISLATTVFFAGATSDARGQVALFLGLTMLPFAIVAPLIGPFLDRFRHGRRWAIGATFALRAFLCWILAGAVADESALLYPCALGVLVSSKAYGVTKAAAVPRLVPQDITLVKANGRVSLAGIVGAGLSAPIAGAAAYFGGQWSLRYAFCVFVVGVVAAIMLPAKIDSSSGEESMSMRVEGRNPGRGRGTQIPRQVAYALRANCGPKFLSGFLTMYMVFLLRDHPIDDWKPTVLLGLVIGGAGAGNTLGIALASLLRKITPSVTVTVALIADAAVVLYGALFFGILALVLLGLTAGLAASLAKVSLDSTIQSGVPTSVQSSAFARSDTTLQLAWVVGGFVGIAMPLVPGLGLGVAFAVLAAWTVFVLGSRFGGRGPATPPAGAPPRPGRARRPGPGGPAERRMGGSR